MDSWAIRRGSVLQVRGSYNNHAGTIVAQITFERSIDELTPDRLREIAKVVSERSNQFANTSVEIDGILFSTTELFDCLGRKYFAMSPYEKKTGSKEFSKNNKETPDGFTAPSRHGTITAASSRVHTVLQRLMPRWFLHQFGTSLLDDIVQIAKEEGGSSWWWTLAVTFIGFVVKFAWRRFERRRSSEK